MDEARARLESLIEAGGSLQEVLHAVIEDAQELLEGSSSSVVLVDTSGKELLFFAIGGIEGGKSLHKYRFPAGTGITGDVIATGRAALVNEPGSDPRFFQDVERESGLDTRNLLVVPLRFEAQVIGAVCILNKAGGFTDQDLSTLEQLAVVAGEALGRSERLARALRASTFLIQRFEASLDQLMTQTSSGVIAVPEDLGSVVETAADEGSPEALAPDVGAGLWRDRQFLALLASLFISSSGSGITHVAVLWLSYDLTQSATATGAVFICLTLPGVFVGPLAGALADRIPQRHLLLVSRLASALFVLGLCGAAWTRSL
ncbi:MAG: GAF domain-containing protein, partial [Myxococcota bacterium]|nr:GAF domain-containing protein [Myxococcota bacterium]